jgi:hypothetical protein
MNRAICHSLPSLAVSPRRLCAAAHGNVHRAHCAKPAAPHIRRRGNVLEDAKEFLVPLLTMVGKASTIAWSLMPVGYISLLFDRRRASCLLLTSLVKSAVLLARHPFASGECIGLSTSSPNHRVLRLITDPAHAAHHLPPAHTTGIARYHGLPLGSFEVVPYALGGVESGT